jgi:NAD(P)-dependent dehydrogenase (short-subunit alcohol dehydrogenase family)
MEWTVAYFPTFEGRVVLITGASAGVGRATAQEFAKRRAKVALLARESRGLREVQAEIERMGCQAIALAYDVADADAVFAAAEECEARLGPIDVWVNNAMATVFSPVSMITPEEVRRVTEVTYLGCVHGVMAALRHMRRRDHGVIVQVGSSLAYRGIPLQAAYCGAKHAVRGFTDSLRAELVADNSNIAITMVHLPAVNTPQFGWSRTHLESEPRPVAPVYRPELAANAIVEATSDPRREVWLGGSTALLIVGNAMVPSLLDKYLADTATEGQQGSEKVDPSRRDNLFESVDGLHAVRGRFGEEERPSALTFSGPQTRLAAAVGGGLLIALAAFSVGRALRRRPEKRIKQSLLTVFFAARGNVRRRLNGEANTRGFVSGLLGD